MTQTDTGLLSARQILAMLAARRSLIAGTVLAAILVTLLTTLLLPKTWTASSDVYIDYRESDPIAGRTFSPMLDESYMQTQIDMLRSHTVAEEVIATLGLRRDPAYREDASSNGTAQANSRLIEKIVRNIAVSSNRNSRVIEVAYSARSPETAQSYADAVVRSFIAVSQRIASTAARSRSEQYNLQLEQLRGEVDTIQQKLTRYQQEHNILEVDEREDLATRKLGELSTQLSRLQNSRQQAEATNQVIAQLLAAGARIDELPQMAQLPSITDLKSKVSDVTRRLGDTQGVYGANHPTVRGLAAERASLQARIAREARAAYEQQKNDVTSLSAQEQAAQRELDLQRTALLEQKQHRDQIASYQRQLESVEQVYKAALQKYDGLLMASNVTTPNLAVLRPAELPSSPSRPRVLASLAASVMAGLLLGLCLALLLELPRRRLRCLDDMRRDIPLPLIGRIGLPRNPIAR